ncbi:putative cysteine protease [Monocercomonoides exilis]|uniref:putative cysteine protease n=1 Tax=Monocercomonoides exilis TaxID=2049356 RepID=UPI003559E834|nr:putative cysteine protease [Monocercomonoides exilis]|eukprot:MONOS_12784.1-p1 / transcript=MONOS_12784.1 / gene=MONOS_12784 / organism=Monocercomonoides_exilis_PA203 / gene_product=cysteine protease / transcript_product=cysteine protease / location=Mono_scaffold00732:27517-29016(+) / protein_length=362 / sequence_SO=supercontig / SO=protein_coding / is_pseudo=false
MMMDSEEWVPLSFRIRHAEGTELFSGLKSTLTFRELFQLISSKLNVKPGSFQLAKSYPPTLIESEDDFPIGAFIENGETLVLREKQEKDVSESSEASKRMVDDGAFDSQKAESSTREPTEQPKLPSSEQPKKVVKDWEQTRMVDGVAVSGPYKGKRLLRRVMPNDNSCFFHAMHLIFRELGAESPYALREICSNMIMNNPTELGQFLDKPPLEYCDWILKEMSWGGASELSLLSKHFNVEIDSIDVQTLQVMHFGEDLPNVTHRCIVCYNGVHYDVFVMGEHKAETKLFDDKDIALFPISDQVPLALALEKVEKLNKKGMYVDHKQMKMRCKACGREFTGDEEIILHMQVTMHTEYDEIPVD